MTRWLLRAAAVTAGWSGAAAAQPLTPAALANIGTTPAPSVRAAAPEEAPVVLLMRTTGQPDRKLKVLKRSAYDDGEVLVDVQDLASGQTFTLPGKLADRMSRAGDGVATPPHQPQPVTPRPVPAAVAARPPVAGHDPVPGPAAPVPPTPVAASGPYLTPVAAMTEWKAIAQDVSSPPKATAPELVTVPSPTVVPPTAMAPLPAATPVPAAAPRADRWKPIPQPPLPPAPSPTPPPPGDGSGVTVRGQMPSSLGGRPTAFSRTPATKPTASPAADAPGTLPPAGQGLRSAAEKIPPVAPPVPYLSSVPLSTPAPKPPSAVPPPAPERPQPAVSARRPVDPELPKPTFARPAPNESVPPKPVTATPPVAFAPKMPDVLPPAPEAVPPPKSVAVTPAPAQVPLAAPGVAHVSVPAEEFLAAVPPVQPTSARVPNWTPTSDDPLTRAVLQEMRPLEGDLLVAVRPSVRMAAATRLSELRYAARPEVKAVLVKAAMTDPAVAVQIECVRALAQLGYADDGYVAFLKTAAAGAPESLRLAAAEALHRLQPRN